MTDRLPDPLVPPEVDLRGYEFMPLFGDRLFGSTTYIEASLEARVALPRIWWRAYAKEIPASSLPDNDQLLADYAGYGVALKAWKKIRPQVMRGFVLCSDGRWYHPFVAKIAMAAWKSRIADRLRGVKARIGATQKRLKEVQTDHDKAHISHLLQAQEQELSQLHLWSVTAEKHRLSQGPIGEDRKGEERIGTGGTSNVIADFDASTGPPADARDGPSEGTACGALSKALRDLGVVGVTPQHPTLVGWMMSGITPETIFGAVELARDKKPKPLPIPIKYLEPIVEQLRTQPEKKGNGSTGNIDWWSTADGIQAKASEFGLRLEDVPTGEREWMLWEKLTWLRCAIAVRTGGDKWPWIDPRNGVEERLIDEIREAQAHG